MPESKKNDDAEGGGARARGTPLKIANLTSAQKRWLQSGLDQPGGKLPLFDMQGKRIAERTIRSCLDAGWAEPWFSNPIKPEWLVCRLTPAAVEALKASQKTRKS